MNCRRVSDLLPRYVDGDLAGRDLAELLQHLQDCQACREQLDLNQKLAGMLSSLPMPADAAAAETRIAGRVMTEAQSLRRWGAFWRAAFSVGNAAAWVGVGAIAVLLVLGLAVTWKPLVEGRLGAATSTAQPTIEEYITHRPAATPLTVEEYAICPQEKGESFPDGLCALGEDKDRDREILGKRQAWREPRPQPPALMGYDVVTLEQDAEEWQFAVQQGEKTVYTFSAPVGPNDYPVRGLWSWEGHWILEIGNLAGSSRVVVDGEDLNERLGYEEIFGWQLVGGQPFYFFKQGGRIRMSYAGQVLPPEYEVVPHYGCCSAAAFNNHGNDTMVWFYALRDGTWYYVEAGLFEASPMPALTETPTPRPSPSPTPTMTPPPCLATITPQPQARSQPLRVVYADEGTLWLWKEEAGAAAPYTLGGEAYDARLSGDGRLIAFRRPAGERSDEVWVVGIDGEGERRLATFSAGETLARYPEAGEADLIVDWLPNAHTLACYYEPSLKALGYGPYEPLRLVDADAGASHTITAPGDEVWAFAYAPNGRQVAVLTSQELRLIDARDGEVRFRVPVKVRPWRSQSLAYAPDGRYVAVFTERAVTVVDAVDGSRRDIPFDYQPIGMGGGSVYPRINWLGDAPAFYTVFSQGEASQVLGEDATFTLWRVDVAGASAIVLGTYRGSFVGSGFSPDRRWLGYLIRHAGNECDLYLADVQGGRQILYAKGGWNGLRGWDPDSARFVYQQYGRVTLGHICGAPQPLAGVDPDRALGWYDTVWWVDTERFLTVDGSYQSEQWAVKLNSVDGEVTTIATLHAYMPRYGYALEK